ncbi:hypothetical protein PSEUDT2_04142 [Stutzerimonas stutzeri]|uniref:hypothetical protein n=1 Tax=Stutzerimonas stutzeri TaxID=316 RepID=UPI001645B802|nr:hypothetical protein [Stutzerimonas stutzeri]CAD2261430.1 hypothetical protein PSEUDT2_04142 [Stutzerimonas stutzeri]
MTNQAHTAPTKPMSKLLDSIHLLERSHEELVDAEQRLADAKRSFDEQVAHRNTAYTAACNRAIEMGEKNFPERFALRGLVLTFDDEGGCSVERSAIVEPYELLGWARKAGEESTPCA